MASESFQRKILDSPDETRTFEHGKVGVVTLGVLSPRSPNTLRSSSACPRALAPTLTPLSASGHDNRRTKPH